MDYKEKVIVLLNSQELSKEQKEKLESIFPELKESEDEKIRKAIIKLVKKAGEGYENVIDGVSVENAISWLEKQGEHANFINKIQIGDKVTRNRDGMLVNLSQLNRVAKKDENQEYQKPAEWSEEDKNMLQSILDEYKSMPAEKRNWLKSLKDRVQLKQEWNEEDDKMINSIAVHLNATTCGFPEDRAWADRFMNWLNSIKDRVQPQPKQEWSEEDERLRTSCIKHIEEELERIRNDKYGHSEIISDLKESCRERINWLKSIKDRYTWKPSKLPHWQKSNLPNDNTTGFNSDYFCHKGYYINYKELFEKLPKDD